MTPVEALIQSFPTSKRAEKCIPCSDGEYVILRHVTTREQLAIFILYDYGKNGAFLPFTVNAYCKIPKQSLGEEYEDILNLFLEQQAKDRDYFLSGALYLCYLSLIHI